MTSSTDPQVHSTALISPGARLAPGVVVGPYVVVGDRVEIGENTRIGPSTVIEGPARIGRNNHFYGHGSIGTDPQDLKFQGEETWLVLGDGNQVREFVTINRGTAGGERRTFVGDNNLLMTGVHIAHDCRVGDRVILANAATLAGHVRVEDDSTVGAFTGVHQFCRVGRHAFIGGYSVITRDALPFVKTVGIRGDAKTYGVNTIGLERKGFSADRLEALKEAYRALFHRGLRLAEAIAELRSRGALQEDVRTLVEFIETSERGFVR